VAVPHVACWTVVTGAVEPVSMRSVETEPWTPAAAATFSCGVSQDHGTFDHSPFLMVIHQTEPVD
jgi:hypothetical protein